MIDSTIVLTFNNKPSRTNNCFVNLGRYLIPSPAPLLAVCK
jgi:hypothetical protein